MRTALRRHGLVRRPSDIAERVGRHRLRFSDGNAVELFDCGHDAFPEMLDAIAQAEDFVHLETYTLRADRIGTRFIEALVERAAAGVDVRLIYDALGSHELDTTALEPLREAGGEIVVFNPLRRLYPNWAPRRRDHRKLLIVDGTVGFTGGLNIGDEYDAKPVSDGEEKGWRDSHVRVHGPVVRELGAVFLESWFRAGGAELAWHDLLHTEPDRPGPERCAVLPDGPVYRRRAMRDHLVSALDDAADSARLTSPYFIPEAEVLSALGRAAERGPRVELILAGHTDHPILRWAARSMLERLLKRGVHVYEYKAAMLHAKTAVFDGDYGFVGTSNLDRQSLQHNYEVNLIVDGGSLPKELDHQFEADREHCEEVTLDGLARRNPVSKLIDRIAALGVRALL